MRKAYLLCFFAFPVFLPAQTLPPAFQNVFPSPFRDAKTPTVRAWPAPTKTVVTPNAMPERLCAGPIPSAKLTAQSEMPLRQGPPSADPDMILWVKPCYPNPER